MNPGGCAGEERRREDLTTVSVLFIEKVACIRYYSLKADNRIGRKIEIDEIVLMEHHSK